MLGHALHNTGSFGFPLEYANPANLAEWKKRLHIDNLKDVIKEIEKRRPSPNGVFAIKIHYSHIYIFGGFSKLTELFPNAYFLLLSREYVLKQAVSLSIASQTGVWISGQKSVNENPVYSFKHIYSCLRETILDNSSWRYSLAASKSNYLEFNFDDVRNNIVQSIEKIANFTGVDINTSDIPSLPVTKKQSNSINKEWLVRYVSDFNKSAELIDIKMFARKSFVKQSVNRLLEILKNRMQ
ncbi:Stf0 family sulfotransferase [Arsukibacterium sp. MJ3]|uniref:Stf0 family sulfotransferase n=1 Tax=Arsukibacterium sp. MJ3 TaxID=1632859 RepID=UPI00069A3686|nr:Stf0 family sulfotransferase [Arsukibacterium sp. MJ3]